MHGPMGYGSGWHMGSPGQHHGGVPFVPAPMAFLALMFGLMMGVMIGRRRAMMHGMGMGMGGECGRGMMRSKMMGMMSAHHHHGNGMPQCACDESTDVADWGRARRAAE